MQALPGFREFYPEEAARREAIISTWRAVARRYALEEYDGPTLESLDLYAKKNAGGAEILGQLYRFADGGGREVALRPEMTPTLARMVGAREKHYRKPIKWFAIGSFFRFERQQRGRLREFLQFNCDILGDEGPEADAELIALSIDTLRAFGLGANEIALHLSHRGAWMQFLETRGLTPSAAHVALQVVDKLGRDSEDALAARLQPTGLTLDDLRGFMEGPTPDVLTPIVRALEARGLGDFVKIDLSIVRGLAYYTGVVFEIFDRAGEMRAVAGGGRYDGLVGDLSEGGSSGMPAVGFGMGDVVLSNLIASNATAEEALQQKILRSRTCDIYVVVADESHRAEALRLVQTLREGELRVDFPLCPQKVGKQFQAASASGAAYAIVVGAEWPSVKIKTLSTRDEVSMLHDALADWLKNTQF